MDTHDKYIRLFGTLFFTFLGFVLSIIILLLGLRFIFGLLDHIPWFTYIFMVFIICVPAALFIPVYIVYFNRTRTHVSAPVRIISYIIFTAALSAWIYFLVTDLLLFFKHYYNAVGEYGSYDMVFLAANVFAIFLVGIIQALSTKKEPDWLDKHRED
jgi:hypothetical protein